MPTDHDALTQELAALMKAHNTWTMRVERLRRMAGALGDVSVDQLKQLETELEQARAQATQWEQKARSLSQVLYKERSERTRRIRELEQELMQLKDPAI